ncbi:MAG TPA: nucleoside-triphosphatase [Elusimicrobiota bacterium]|nr:nucleoside-triphosphatase [Elusimicrobiota bacterium]
MSNETRPLPKNLFLTGTPGVGKTTLIKEVTLPYLDRVAGFYTEELKEGPERKGFWMKSFMPLSSGLSGGLLAKKGMKSPTKLGKYGVDMKILEGVGAAALSEAMARSGTVLVIDELGSMEVLSDLFRKKLLECLQSKGHPVLATIRFNAQPFTGHVKRLADSALLRLTRENFVETKTEVRRWLEGQLLSNKSQGQ